MDSVGSTDRKYDEDAGPDHTLTDIPAVEQTQQIPAVSGGAR